MFVGIFAEKGDTMRGINIGKILIKLIYCIAVFFVSLFIFSGICNQGNDDMTTTMSKAKYPTISFKYNGMKLGILHGYAEDVDIMYLREGMIPLMSGRNMSLSIDTYGTFVNGISYEVRSVDGSRLIEDTPVYNYLNDGKTITADITLKDLYEKQEPYLMCIKVQTEGEVIKYFAKIIETDVSIDEKLKFAYYFSETSFDKIKSADELKTYMESNSRGDNSSFHRVDIHSSMEQVTWGNLQPSLETEMIASLKEFDSTMGIITVDYFVSTGDGEDKVYYKVQDTYRMREGKDRLYLLEFYRDMNQIFALSNGTINNNKIVLGITGDDVELKESQDGNQLVFVNSGRLYSYNINDNKLGYLFGFYEDESQVGFREAFQDYDIKPFNIDENGNVYFMVYGYMPRGDHEGHMGISIYYYDAIINNVEEKMFLDYDRDFDMLSKQVETLSFVNTNNSGFVFVEDTIYKIDLEKSESNIIANNIPFGGLVVSNDSDMLAYVSGGDINNASQIVMINLVTGSETYVQAGDNKRIKTIGFFGDHLIYGIAEKDDIYTETNGNTVFPINTIIIRDEKGNIYKEYSEDGVYIMDTDLDETMLSLTRARRSDGEYVSLPNDQILNNKVDIVYKNNIEKAVTENYETIVQLAVKNPMDTEKMRILTPKQVMYEGIRSDSIGRGQLDNRYYVYVMGALTEVTDNISEAIMMADTNNGSVTDSLGKCIYLKSTLAKKNQIMAITGTSVKEDGGIEDTLPVCLNTILELNGKNLDTRRDIKRGESPEDILAANIENITVLDISTCSLDASLYFIEKDIPVLVTGRDGMSVLLIGYNDIEIVIMNPISGEVYKISKTEAEKYFDGTHKIVTYAKK